MTTDPQLDAALDRFIIPPPRADLVERIANSAFGRGRTSLPPVTSFQRDRRGGWTRGRTVLGLVALGLMSATAAAAGWFGAPVRIPVISQIVASVTPKPAPEKPAPKAVVAKPKSPASPYIAEPEVQLEIPPLPPPEAFAGTPEANRAERAAKLAERMEARLSEIESRRAQKGKPPLTEARRALLEKLKTANTDDERKAALQAIRADNQRLRWVAPPSGDQLERRARFRERLANLPSEERAALREQLKQRRAERLKRTEELNMGSEMEPVEPGNQTSASSE